MIIVCEDGRKGSVTRRIKSKDRPDQLVIEFEDGTRLTTSEAQLRLQEDGTSLLSRKSATLSSIPIQAIELAHGEELVVPVAMEELQIQKRRVVRGVVHVQTRVETSEETVDEPLLHEEVTVERIPIDKEIHGELPKVQEKNGILVIPVVEEVIVVSKQLRLKEEIRVIRRQTTVHKPQNFQLRRQIVDVERVEDGTVLAELGQYQEPLPKKPATAAAKNAVAEKNIEIEEVSAKPPSPASKKSASTAKKSTPPAREDASAKKSPPPTPKKRGR